MSSVSTEAEAMPIGSSNKQQTHADAQSSHNQASSQNASTNESLFDPTPSPNAVCDRCSTSIGGVRYKCQQCPDFDYCSKCVRLASSIHPKHTFVPLLGINSLSEEERIQRVQDANQEALEPTTFRLLGQNTDVPTNLCLSCQPVTIPLPAVGIILQDEQVRKQGKNGLQLRWPARISRLVEATVGGCAFCSLILHRFFGPGNAIMFAYEPDIPHECQIDNPFRQSVVDNAMHLLTLMKSDEFVFAVEPVRGKGVTKDTDFSRLRIELKEAKQSKEVLDRALASRGQQYIELDVYAADGNPAAEFVSARPPNASPRSQRSLTQVTSWLNQCEKEHGEACGSHSPIPTRVIDISDSSKLRLVETSSDNSIGRYVALSYCWGEAGDLQTTTTSSLNDRLAGFAVAELPQTLQDAVTVTRALGINYLWVDCLCILQNDARDKAHEIANMANIYKHATLTISASKAAGASKGFLHDQASPETGLWKNLIPLAFPIPEPTAKTIQEAFERPRKVLGTLWLCDEDPDMSATFRSPVDRRGWCLQERLLSSRLLSYGRWPTWRCSLGTYSDGGFYPHNGKREKYERQLTKCLYELRRRQRLSGGPKHTDFHTSIQLLQSWYKLLNEYTQRELGVKSDRLPAIGGIAAEISRVTGYGYVAGLWQPNLLHDLMWSCKAKEWMTRPEGYQGPTWSWAAVDCPVTYDDITDDSLALARVVECSIDADDGSSGFGPFGEVNHRSRLELEGPFLARASKQDVITLLRGQDMAEPPPLSNDVNEWYRQIMEFVQNQPRTSGSANHNKTAQNGGGEGGTEKSWDDALLEDGQEISALITFSRDWRVVAEKRVDGLFYSGLLLRKVGGPDEGQCRYERIGAFMNEDCAWMDQAALPWETEKVVLV